MRSQNKCDMGGPRPNSLVCCTSFVIVLCYLYVKIVYSTSFVNWCWMDDVPTNDSVIILFYLGNY